MPCPADGLMRRRDAETSCQPLQVGTVKPQLLRGACPVALIPGEGIGDSLNLEQINGFGKRERRHVWRWYFRVGGRLSGG